MTDQTMAFSANQKPLRFSEALAQSAFDPLSAHITHELRIALGTTFLAENIVLYAWVLHRRLCKANERSSPTYQV